MPVISLLQERHDFFPLRKRYPCHNPQRTITYDASIELGEEAVADDSHGRGRRAKRDAESLSQMLSRVQSKVEEDNTFLTTVGGGMDGSRRAKANGQSSAISDGPMPFISPLAASITRMAMWSAHADSILSLQVIKEPPALITSGYDRLVRLWDQSGNSLGKFQRGHMNRTDWSFKANVEKFAQNKRNEANNIIGRINRVVSAEEQKRKMGDFENANPFYEVSDDEDVDGIGASKTVPRYKLDIAKIKARAKATGEAESESQIDSVRLDIANLDETRARLISDYSNLSIFERNNRSAAGGGLADSLRRTPRMAPVGPQQAGKGYSATPRGRSSRLKTGSRSFKVGISRRRK
jgi:hypothetical protein